MTDSIWSKLAAPFPIADIEWRLQRCGDGDDGKPPWAIVIPYVTNRAIQQRLDDVLGPENWKNEYREMFANGNGEIATPTVLCGLSIKVGEDWIQKWDGAEQTDIASAKGGLSASMKRAAVQFGLGRYMYRIEEGWARVFGSKQRGAEQGKTKSGKKFWWLPPADLCQMIANKATLPPAQFEEQERKAQEKDKRLDLHSRFKIDGVKIVHEPTEKGKDFWVLEGRTEGLEKVLRDLKWKQTRTSKRWYTESPEAVEELNLLMADETPQSFDDVPRQLVAPEPAPPWEAS